MFSYRKKIIRPIDWIKQPTEDILRLVSRVIYLLIKFFISQKIL